MNVRNPKVSVLMPVYNGEKFLREAIESILNQTYKDFEFLIINDGSTDSSRDIILSFGDSRIKLIDNDKNLGLTKSLNKGIAMAKGEYIARMDADDISMPERLEKEVYVLNQNKNIGLVWTYYLIINDKGRILFERKPVDKEKQLKELLLTGNPVAHGSVMIRKGCLEEVGAYREELIACEDYDLWMRLTFFFDAANIPEFLYKWRLTANSISVHKKAHQDKYSSLALKLAKVRRHFGKDCLQICNEADKEMVLNNLLLKADTQNQMLVTNGFYLWSVELYMGKAYGDALKLLMKSFVYNPLDIKTWVLILKSLILIVFPSTIANKLKYFKRLK